MTTQTTTYDAPAVYLPRLIAWAQAGAAHYAACAETQRHRGAQGNAASYEDLASEWTLMAARARERLNDIAECALTEREQQEPTAVSEPPRTLPGLTDWLVALLGPFFPLMPRQGWQTIACALHVWRPQV